MKYMQSAKQIRRHAKEYIRMLMFYAS